MLRIGLTGGIGAGKSTIAEQFRSRGVPVIDADRIAREIVEPGAPALAALSAEFGTQILTAAGELDRAALAQIAFADADATVRLNAIMHPAIARRTEELYAAHAGEPIVVHDVPLLVENRMSSRYHLAVLVDTPAELRLQRLVESRGMDPADARRRIEAQAEDDERYAACDVVIDNSGTPAEAEEAFAAVFDTRIRPFAANLAAGIPAHLQQLTAAAHSAGAGTDAGCAASRAHAADRLRARIERALHTAGSADATVSADDGGAQEEIALDVRIGVRGSAEGSADAAGSDAAEHYAAGSDAAEHDAVRGAAAEALTAAGFPPDRADAEQLSDSSHSTGPSTHSTVHRSADPGQPAIVRLAW